MFKWLLHIKIFLKYTLLTLLSGIKLTKSIAVIRQESPPRRTVPESGSSLNCCWFSIVVGMTMRLWTPLIRVAVV